MSIFGWCTRRVGGLSVVALIGLIYWSLSSEVVPGTFDFRSHREISDYKDSESLTHNGGWSSVIFAYYSLLLHAMVVLVFPIRACWAVDSLTRGVQNVARNRALKDFKYSQQRRLSSTSLSSAETLTSQASTTSSEAGDIDSADSTTDIELDQDKIIHAIIIPNYKEDIDGLRETLDVLASHPQARSSYDVYLGMEARETGAEMKALGLVSEYIKKFRFIHFTMHPSDIPGEAPGKSSNTAWAARKASERYPLNQRRDVIVTGIDADSHLSSNYFSLITSMHLAHPEIASTTLYSAPIIFDRNAHLVPALVRVADILWCAAGLSGLYASSSIRPPTSVYSLPLELVDRVGGWDTDPEAIGEDLHMYLKCFFALNGNLTSRTILAPVSQTSVSSGQKGYRGMAADVQARYKQAMRHMWGALDSGYAMRQMVQLWKERKTTVRSYRPLHSSAIGVENDYMPEPDYEKQLPVENGIFSDVTHDTVPPPHWSQIFFLFHRLFEAHFLPSHMAVLVVSSAIYMFFVKDKPDTLGLNWTFVLANYLRMIGFGGTAVYMVFYERYHKICATAREAEMRSVGLADHMVFSYRNWKKNFVDYLVFPIVAPLYGSIPAAQAQICHFWTVDLVYAVSQKPMLLRQRAKSLVQEVLGA